VRSNLHASTAGLGVVRSRAGCGMTVPKKLSNRLLRLEFDPYPKRAGVIVELIIPDHGPEIHERLPAMRQDHYEASPQIKIVPDGDIVLERELGRSGAQVLGELHMDKPLRVGEFMDVVRIHLRNQDPEAGTKGG